MPNNRRIYAAVTASLGWFALAIQLYVLLEKSTADFGEAITQYFSYFTILTNGLVATWFTSVIFVKNKQDHFFGKPGTQAAITVYILVVGITYNLILRFTWHPEGLHRVADELLHTILPVLTLIYWWLYSPKNLSYKQTVSWLLFPFAYIVFVGIRGAASSFYPYPFIDVTKLGYPGALRNGMIFVLVFICLSVILVAAAKWLSGRDHQHS